MHAAPRFQRHVAAAVVALSLASTPVVAGAQAQPANQPMTTSARQHFEAGSRFYTERRFADAAREFLAALNISHRPELLFNLGRAYEDAGMTAEALEAYERFERAGAPGYDRAQLGARIAPLRARVEALRREREAAQAAEAARLAALRPVAPPPPPPARSLALPIALMVTGGVVLASALPFWVLARSGRNDLDARCPDQTCPASQRGEIEDELSTLRTQMLVGDVLAGVGVATLAAGVIVLATRGGSRPATGHTATVGCTATGCAAGVRVRF